MQKVTVLLLAAGFGSRLRELTQSVPKPLISLGSGRLIESALWQLKKAGLNEIIINLHYLGDLIESYLGSGEKYGLSITYSWENPILGTGGAIKKVMQDCPDRSILILNSDTVFDENLDLAGFVDDFLKKSDRQIGCMLTSPVKKKDELRITWDIKEQQERVTGILDYQLPLRGNEPISWAKFTGVHILAPKAFKYMQKLGDVFSSTQDLYPLMLKEREFVGALPYSGLWIDGGKKERLAEIRNGVTIGKVKLLSASK